MKIINPLYDKAFKYLMENEKYARKVLSVILDEDVVDVQLGQQETHFPDTRHQLTLFRLDFKAQIRQEDGSEKTVLIELQKSKYTTDIQRFRSYLGSNYMAKKRKAVAEENPPEYQPAYPMIAIYILGYNLPDLPYMAVKVEREVINSVSKERVEVDSFFIEHLTHASHIIQVRRLPERPRSRLEQFLSLFDQARCTENAYILELSESPEEFADIAHYLQGPVMDEDFRRNLEAEEELDTIFDQQEAKYQQKIREIELRAQAKEKKLLIKLARLLKAQGKSKLQIVEETGLTPEEIEKI